MNLIKKLVELKITNQVCSTTLIALRESSGVTTKDWNYAIGWARTKPNWQDR